MLFASLLAIFLIPVMFYVVERLSHHVKAKGRQPAPAGPQDEGEPA
jgi:hypothetical protein